jgi:iron(III) transport system substrate-binding protein
MHKSRLLLAPLVALTILLSACGGGAETDAATAAKLADINKLSGDARQAALYKEAKKESSVTWYTGLIPEQLVEPMKKAFEAKYPGVSLKYYRAGSDDIASKMLIEAKAHSPKSDVWDGAHAGEALKAAGAAEKYQSPSAADYPEELKDASGYWTATNIYVKGIAYNTKAIDAADKPTTFQDLLKPEFKGQMAWTPEATGGGDFVGNVMNTLGDDRGTEYFDKLADQDMNVVNVSSRELLNMAVSNQYPVVISVFNNHVAISAKEGAPVAFAPLDAASKELNPLGITRGARHPFAARLLVDYLLSPEGQKVFRDADYIPSSPDVKPADPSIDPDSGQFKTTLLSPHVIETESDEWLKIFDKVN